MKKSVLFLFISGLSLAIFAFFISAVFSGCAKQGNERLEEKARIEGGAAADEQAQREKQLLNERSSDMETTLNKIYDFYESRSGHFEGTISSGNETFKVQISLFPNISRNKLNRIRTPGEVEADLIKLSLNADIMQQKEGNILSTTKCKIKDLKPDLNTGQVNIISENCQFSYYLTLNVNEITGTASSSLVFALNATRVDETSWKELVK